MPFPWAPWLPGDLNLSSCQGSALVLFSFLSAAAAAKSLQSCPTLCDPIDGSPPGSPVPGILQARTLEWVAISFSSQLFVDAFKATTVCCRGLPGGSVGKVSAYNAGDLGSSPGLGRSPGEGNGNPLQYYRLENPVDRGVWQAAVYGVAKSRTRLSDFTSEDC